MAHRVGIPAVGLMGAPALQVGDLYRFFRTGDDETLALRGGLLTSTTHGVLS